MGIAFLVNSTQIRLLICFSSWSPLRVVLSDLGVTIYGSLYVCLSWSFFVYCGSSVTSLSSTEFHAFIWKLLAAYVTHLKWWLMIITDPPLCLFLFFFLFWGGCCGDFFSGVGALPLDGYNPLVEYKHFCNYNIVCLNNVGDTCYLWVSFTFLYKRI